MLTTPLPWLLVAAALVFAGGSPSTGPRPVGGRHGPHLHRSRLHRSRSTVQADAEQARAARLSRRGLCLAAAGAVIAASIALAGPVTGLGAAAFLGPAAAAVTGRFVDRPAARRPDAALARALDLAAAVLRSGQSVPTALTLTAPVLPGPLAAQWRRTAALLALGADPVRAWTDLGTDPALAPVATAARRSADSGARLARTFTQLAADTRAAVRADALARANRAGVFAMAPLGLCFLPAFICLGIVPTVVGIAQGVLR